MQGQGSLLEGVETESQSHRMRVGGGEMEVDIVGGDRSFGNLNLEYQYISNQMEMLAGFDSSFFKTRYHAIDFYFSQFHLRHSDVRIGIKREYFRIPSVYYMSSTRLGLSDSTVYVSVKAYARYRYDNLDNGIVPKRGISFELGGDYSFIRQEKMGSFWGNGDESWYVHEEPLLAVNMKLRYYYTPNNGRFTIIPQLYARTNLNKDFDECGFYEHNLAGGMVDGRFFETQMPFVGVNNTYDLDFRTGVARLDLRYNIWGKSYISLIGNVLAKDNWGIDMRTFATVFNHETHAINEHLLWGSDVIYGDLDEPVILTVSITGVDDLRAAANGILITPTIVLDNIKVQAGSELKAVRVFAPNGSLVHEVKNMGDNVATLSLSHLPTGVYLVEAATVNGYRVTKRIIKQ